MTKKMFFMCLIGVISINSAWAKCDGGKVITASSGTFCKSNVDMNWWSAAAWCKANGMKLATMYEMCPTWDGNRGANKCSELNGTDDTTGIISYSATASDTVNAWGVYLNNGFVDARSRLQADSYSKGFAFCR